MSVHVCTCNAGVCALPVSSKKKIKNPFSLDDDMVCSRWLSIKDSPLCEPRDTRMLDPVIVMVAC